MSKYDCNNIIDYGHEYLRLCDSHPSCNDDNDKCPLRGRYCGTLGHITQDEIDILQKWSDEHPELPKLTKKDRMFLECFVGVDGRIITKDNNGNVYYYYDGMSSMLAPDMFKALEPDTRMTFEELLKLEVEE